MNYIAIFAKWFANTLRDTLAGFMDAFRFNHELENGRSEVKVTVNADFTATLEGIAESGESITIPSAVVNQICEGSDERNVMQDIRAQSADYDLVADLSEEELRKLAKSVIRGRENCDGISEGYWSIVDEVIRDFSATKQQEA